MGWLEIVFLIFGVIGFVVGVIQLPLWYREWQRNRTDSFSAIERHGIQLLRKIRQSGYKPDFVLGLGRSGALIGGWLAGNLGSIRIEVIDRVHKEGKAQSMEFPHIDKRLQLLSAIYGQTAQVLVVEGATTRGTTFQEFETIRHAVLPKWDCRFCVVYEIDTNLFEMDFVGKRLPRAPESYPWHATDDYKKFIRKTKGLEV
jgi:hypoxanthine phosphoribosyltransferase